MASGGFNYSIPLMDVGGYPLQLSYDADIVMEQQASMVGLGWNLNLDAINRTVRGIPDDFNGDEITTTMNLRPRLTIENTFTPSLELVGADLGLDDDATTGDTTSLTVSVDIGFTFNNYTGNENSLGVSGSTGVTRYTNKVAGPGAFLNAGIGSSSRGGLSTNLGVSMAMGKKGQFSSSLGLNKNSLYGSSLTFGYGYTYSHRNIAKKLGRNFRSNSISGVFPLGMQSYTPTATFDFKNKSWTVDVAAGGTVYAGIDIHGSYSRTKSTVCLNEPTKSQKAYGYMNQENGYDKEALQDFNLSLPQVYENGYGVPTPMPTNDYFSTPEGLFRAVRNDAGYVKNPETRSTGNATSLSGDVAFGPLGTEGGVNVSYNRSNTTSGDWPVSNPFSVLGEGAFMYTNYLPSADVSSQARHEKFTFLKVGNRSSTDTSRYTGMRKESALRQDIAISSSDITANATFVEDIGTTSYPVATRTYYQQERRDRNVVMEHLNNRELRLMGNNIIYSYPLNDFDFSSGDYDTKIPVNRSIANYPSNHIGELTIIKGRGARDVYGLPVMNESDNVSFNMSAINNAGLDAPEVDAQGLVKYESTGPNADNSTGNKRGDDHFYMKNHVPKHATSYLLTHKLSSNYSDKTGNGPTPDDYGNYVKFNYGYVGIMNWRFPFEQNKAMFDEGFKSNKLDDKGSYSHGIRDSWYVHSIESKDYIAEFSYGDRLDAHGAAGENGGVNGGQVSKRLDKIQLFSRKAKEYYGNSATPIKTVHFEYEYLLCAGTPDFAPETGAKLTLTGVFFTGYDSPQGELNKYKFSYGLNPSFNLGQTDRWGNYKPAPGIDYSVGSSLDNAEYPYANQNKAVADGNAHAWKLDKIDLPTGGRVEIGYEAGDYEYIQDAEATNMYKISGFHSTSSSPGAFKPTLDTHFGNQVFDPTDEDEKHFYIRVDLDEGLTGSEGEAETVFANHFLPIRKSAFTPRYLYYNTLLDLAPHFDGIDDPQVWDYIQGYAEIIDYGWYLLQSNPSSGIWDQVVFRVKPDKINPSKDSSPDAHPISRKAWQVINKAMPLVMYPENDLQAIYAKDGSINCGDDVELEDGDTDPDLGDDSRNHAKNIKSRKSVYHMMKKTGYAASAVFPKCWVRMRNGLTSKVGGSYRVKWVKTYDNWDAFVSGENASVYGKQYTYTTTNPLGTEISSGVASYEPLNSGSDENALRYPVYYEHAQKGIPTERFYTEFPLNEQIFATAEVRYSKITSSSIDYEGLIINTTGHSVHDNFTAKDYPIRLDDTNTDSKNPPAVATIFGVRKERFGVSYGYSVVTNDMHGKFKGRADFGASGELIYRMEHKYHQTPYVDHFGVERKKLVNKLPVVFADGSSSERIIGQNADLITFLSKSEVNSTTVGLKMNLEFGAPFVVVPSAWPDFNTNETSIYTTLTTKVIYQSGILEKVEVEDQGRSKSTKNLLYDAQTGSAIVTEIEPEEGPGLQYMYDYNYPAYWAYEGMGLTSDNSGIRRENITGSGTTIIPSEKPYFYPGDELVILEYSPASALIPSNALGKHWVVRNETTGDYFLADVDGFVFTPVPTTRYEFKVQHPGKTNETGEMIANVASLAKYTGESPYVEGYPHTDIINISGLDFFEKAKLSANTCLGADDRINPYVHHLRGEWKPRNTYIYDGDRSYATGNSRVDGLLTEYQPFWQNVGGSWVKMEEPLQDWIKTSTATLYDAYGHGLESKDALNIYASNGRGYNEQITKYSTANARYLEAGYAGFEDYYVAGVVNGVSTSPDGVITPNFSPYACTSNHFDLNAAGKTSSGEAHTGSQSLFVAGPANGFFSIHTWDGVEALESLHSSPYILQEAEIIPGFRLITDQDVNRYVLTVWAKELDPEKVINFDGAGVSIASAVDVVEKRSDIIDGWQRIEVEFTIPATTATNTEIIFHLEALDGRAVHYDDLRIQPYDSEMQSTVTDPINRRKAANLGGRDFYTTYQYDENGTMVRIIQETERGTQTVKESRSGSRIAN